MAKRIDESTADDSQGWIFAQVVYDSWVMTSRNIAVYRYDGISWGGVLSPAIYS